MATKTVLSIEEYDALPEKEGVKYELNGGELIIVAPSPRLVHNRVRDRLSRRLATFVEEKGLGEVTSETDFNWSEGVGRIRMWLSSGRIGCGESIRESGSK